MRRQLLVAVLAAGACVVLSGTAAASTGNKPHHPQTMPKPKPVVVAPQPKTYTVQAGDYLSEIAANEGLASWQPIWNANTQITDPDLIYAGEVLTIPSGPTTDRPLPAGTVTTAAVTSSTAVTVAPANYAQGVGGLLARVRMRESGGNYADNTGNGYYGAYQFSLGTWESVGGTGLPSNASPAEQDMRAQMLYDERGCSPWPNTCY